MVRSDKSKSFMREHEFIGICNEEDEDDTGFYVDKKGVLKESQLDLDAVFRKTSKGTLLLQKNTLLRLTSDRGMNRNVVVNAINLQDYSLNQIKKVIKNLTEELKKNKVKGILEFHANDTTQSSYHFHFWTWEHYELKARAVISDYILENNYASFNNIKIEGDYKKKINKDSSQEEKNIVKQANKDSKLDVEKEEKKDTLRILNSDEKRKERFRILKEAISPTITLPKKESIKVSSKTESNKQAISIFDKLLLQAKKQKVSSGSVRVLKKADEFDFEEANKKLELLKSKVKILKK